MLSRLRWWGSARRGRSRPASATSRIALTLAFAMVVALLAEPVLSVVKPASAQTAITVTDVVGRSVTVNVPVQRVILGEARTIYSVAAIESEDPFARIVGWAEDLKTTDLDSYERYGQLFPKMYEIPVLGRAGAATFSVEKAIDLQPDLLLMSVDDYGPARDGGTLDTLTKVGIPVAVVDYRQQQLETTVPSNVLLGRLWGREDRAQAVNDYYLQQINVVYSRVEKLKETIPNVFLFRTATVAECCPSFGRSTLGLLVERAGGTNIGAQRIPGHTGVLNPEFVLTSDPDIIVATGSNWTFSPTLTDKGYISLGLGADPAVAKEQLRRLAAETPGFPGLKAVQGNRVHAIWHQFYGSPYHFAALQQIAKWNYPAAFADVNPEASLRTFHERFLPIPYSGAFWVSLAD